VCEVHTTAALRAFAGKLDDPKTLQQMWLMPAAAGAASSEHRTIPRPPITDGRDDAVG
jgi:hypothetical protein